MTRDELKQRVDEAIERHADEIVTVGEAIRRHPELGFKERKTAALVETKFRELGLSARTGLALTGVRAGSTPADQRSGSVILRKPVSASAPGP